MTYRFECRCGKKLEAAEADLGEEIRCPQCGARVLLPFKPEGTHGYVERERLARPALVLSLLPIALILYAAIETAACGQWSVLKTAFNLIGIVLWLGQIVTVVLGAIALRRIKLADKAGNLLEGEKEATVAVVLGSVWLALFARFLLFYFMHI